jgi:hypothetical protein
MHEEYLDDGYWVIIDTKKNNTIYSKCLEWDEEKLGIPSKWRLMDFVSEHKGFRGIIMRWGVPVNKIIASVNLTLEEDHGEFGLGGDWWKE